MPQRLDDLIDANVSEHSPPVAVELTLGRRGSTFGILEKDLAYLHARDQRYGNGPDISNLERKAAAKAGMNSRGSLDDEAPASPFRFPCDEPPNRAEASTIRT